MTPRVTIRAACHRDLDRVCELNRFVHDSHVAARPDIFRAKPPRAELRSFFVALLDNPKHHLLVAEVDGESMGYLWAEVQSRSANTFKLRQDRIYVHQISVHPSSRRRGVGRELFAAVSAVAESEGIEDLALDSWSFNSSAHSFFEALGFSTYNVKMSRRQSGWSHPSDPTE